MTNNKLFIRQEMMVGDAAVDGLLSGVVAGVAMAAYLALIGLIMGEGPGRVLGRFDPGETALPLTGILMHLAVAGVYGLLFGLGRWFTPRRWSGKAPGWLMGLVYGLGLLLLARTVFLSDAGSPLREIPSLHFAVAHLIYGLTLGMLIDRTQ